MGKNKLHPGAKWLFRLGSYFTLIFVGLFIFVWGGAVASIFLGGITWLLIPLIYIIFVVVIGETYTKMAYNRWFYEFTDRALKIEKGVIWKQYKSIPYERIQNIDLHRGILARMFGFSTIDIQTAGYSGGYSRRGGRMKSEGHIPAVSVEAGEKIRDYVMKRITGKGKKSGGL